MVRESPSLAVYSLAEMEEKCKENPREIRGKCERSEKEVRKKNEILEETGGILGVILGVKPLDSNRGILYNKC